VFRDIGCKAHEHRTKQEHIRRMVPNAMPFDLSKTVPIFRMTNSGGVQRVIVKDATATDQVTLIQQHLQKDARAFQRGDFSAPAALYGVNMPGLKELQAGAPNL
jgi:hypothetical protein